MNFIDAKSKNNHLFRESLLLILPTNMNDAVMNTARCFIKKLDA